MNAEQLNAIKERAAKATPGPWKYSEQYGYLAPIIPHQSVAVICNEISRNDDAEFLASCREDVPALVAEVERLQISDASKEASSIRYYNDYQTEKMKCSATLHELIRAETENARLRKALEYYADEKHYEPYAITDVNPCDITEDGGYIAREALK